MKRIGPIFLVAMLLFFCEETPVDEVKDPTWTINASVFPNIGTDQTTFQPTLLALLNGDTAQIGSDYQVRVDYDNDGTADTEWLDTIPKTQTFTQTGKHVLNLELRDTTGYIFTTLCSIYVQQLVQITPTNTSGNMQGNIDWSRDGSNRIAFDMYGADSGGNQNIYYVQYPDGEPVKVSSNPTPGDYFFDQFPEWSPTGDQIACYSSYGLDVINVESGLRTTLDARGSYIMLAWSPDGRWLAYWDGVSTLLYDFENGTAEELFNKPYQLTWSPDGSKIAIVTGSVPAPELQIIDFNSKTLIHRYSVPAFGSKLEWSSDGRWISMGFVEDTGYLFNTETETVHTFRVDGLIHVWYPGWSEDASLLAFEAQKNESGVWTSIWAIEFPDDF